MKKFKNVNGVKIEMSLEEIESLKPRIEEIKKKNIAEIKSTAASEIKKIFTIEDQLNVLMSKDRKAISSMHNQINTILTTSRAEREKLKGAE
tara:strand:+ start:1146 stop:1421 length:276 start_codon:yes stop_codon:yes gene_type:complete